jgi:hypothetical protein
MTSIPKLHLALAAGILFGASPLSFAGTGAAIKIGSTGLGAEVTTSLSGKLNLRLGGNFFNYSYSGTDGDIDYDYDLKLKSFSGLIDLHPSGGSFRLSGGLLANRNALDAAGTSTGSYSIGNGSYTRAQVGTLSGRIEFKKAAPYAGLGFGNGAKGKGLGFVFDLGVVFQGSPRVSLAANGPAAGSSQFQNDLRLEQSSLQEDLKVFRYYPVLALGLSFKF